MLACPAGEVPGRPFQRVQAFLQVCGSVLLPQLENHIVDASDYSFQASGFT